MREFHAKRREQATKLIVGNRCCSVQLSQDLIELLQVGDHPDRILVCDGIALSPVREHSR
jgi:hypothetical protein